MRRIESLCCRGRFVRTRAGQATVEYLIVGLVLLGIIIALGSLAARLGEGLFTEHATRSASHAMTENSAETLGDVILY
jgi:Flp pilus assembly pilin Flp